MFHKIQFSGQASPMYGPARQFLSLRALGAPAVVVSLAIQGIFRGFKDTRTPLLWIGKLNPLSDKSFRTSCIPVM